MIMKSITDKSIHGGKSHYVRK